MQVYKQVFPFYSRDQFERELLRLNHRLESVQRSISDHVSRDATAKQQGDERMRQLQHRLMQKAQAVNPKPLIKSHSPFSLTPQRQKKIDALEAQLKAISS
jgi:hypothetical protein